MNRLHEALGTSPRQLIILTALIAGRVLCIAPQTIAAADKPNIVIVMVDDMGFSDIGCYGAETETPHLDRLARNGLRFTQFYEARFRRQMDMGMFPEETKLAPLDPKTPVWTSIKDKDEMDLRMAIHAAMVHLIDAGVGEVVEKLRELDALDNTLILFLTDNGASAEGGPKGFVRANRGDPKAKTGTPASYVSFGIAGANLCDTPFRKYKMYVHEGGIATPLVAHWPKGIPATLKGTLTHEVGHVIDLLPTCLDVAGVAYPSQHQGRALTPVAGISLAPALRGASLGERELYFEHQGNAAARIGKWKLVRSHGKPWELYDLDLDRTELNNLSKRRPKPVAELKAKWRAWAERVGVETWPIKRSKE